MNWIRIAGLLGFLAVGLGAFGAHGLKARLTPEMLEVFKTGVFYHFFHALAILGLGIFSRLQQGSVDMGAWLFLAGVLLFSGSLYLMAVTGWTKLGMVTPLGGLCFLAGWIWVLIKM